MSTDLLQEISTAASERLTSLTTRLYSGQINLVQWSLGVAGELKDAHLANAVYGAGSESLSLGQLGRVGLTLVDEYRYLFGFAKDIAMGNVSEAQALSRIQLYSKAAQQEYWRETASQQEGLIDWVLAPAENCDDCVVFAAGGPYTSSTLPAYPGSGASACRGNCLCTLVPRS